MVCLLLAHVLLELLIKYSICPLWKELFLENSSVE